jgi:hypothetical protein
MISTDQDRGKAQEHTGANQTGNGAPPGEKQIAPVLVCLAHVKAEVVSWLWLNRIPRGAVTLLDGDPGLGKSTVALDLAARVTRGWEMPPATGPCEGAEPERVLLLSAEDDASRTIRPRLEAAGADLQRVFLLDAIKVGDEERPPVLPWDLTLVESMIREKGITLVIIDPFMAYLGSDIDAHKDQDVRRCMHQLKLLAQQTGAAILIIRHLNKLNHSVALYRGGGSIGIIGAVRSALIVGRDPKNPKTQVLASSKSNLGSIPKSLIYALEPSGNVARVGWCGETDLTADDIVAHDRPRKKSTAQQCADFIRETLIEIGSMKLEDLDESCKRFGFSANAIRDGKRLAGVKLVREGFGPGAVYMVTLAPDCQQEADEAEVHA